MREILIQFQKLSLGYQAYPKVAAVLSRAIEEKQTDNFQIIQRLRDLLSAIQDQPPQDLPPEQLVKSIRDIFSKVLPSYINDFWNKSLPEFTSLPKLLNFFIEIMDEANRFSSANSPPKKEASSDAKDSVDVLTKKTQEKEVVVEISDIKKYANNLDEKDRTIVYETTDSLNYILALCDALQSQTLSPQQQALISLIRHMCKLIMSGVSMGCSLGKFKEFIENLFFQANELSFDIAQDLNSNFVFRIHLDQVKLILGSLKRPVFVFPKNLAVPAFDFKLIMHSAYLPPYVKSLEEAFLQAKNNKKISPALITLLERLKNLLVFRGAALFEDGLPTIEVEQFKHFCDFKGDLIINPSTLDDSNISEIMLQIIKLIGPQVTQLTVLASQYRDMSQHKQKDFVFGVFHDCPNIRYLNLSMYRRMDGGFEQIPVLPSLIFGDALGAIFICDIATREMNVILLNPQGMSINLTSRYTLKFFNHDLFKPTDPIHHLSRGELIFQLPIDAISPFMLCTHSNGFHYNFHLQEITLEKAISTKQIDKVNVLAEHAIPTQFCSDREFKSLDYKESVWDFSTLPPYSVTRLVNPPNPAKQIIIRDVHLPHLPFIPSFAAEEFQRFLSSFLWSNDACGLVVSYCQLVNLLVLGQSNRAVNTVGGHTDAKASTPSCAAKFFVIAKQPDQGSNASTADASATIHGTTEQKRANGDSKGDEKAVDEEESIIAAMQANDDKKFEEKLKSITDNLRNPLLCLSYFESKYQGQYIFERGARHKNLRIANFTLYCLYQAQHFNINSTGHDENVSERIRTLVDSIAVLQFPSEGRGKNCQAALDGLRELCSSPLKLKAPGG